MTQQEICEKMGISRPTVSRMLKNGRLWGFVNIEMKNPDKNDYEELESSIEKKYGLKEVIVVSNHIVAWEEESNVKLGEETLNYLSRILKPRDIAGVSMGRTLFSVANTPNKPDYSINCTFIPIVGGLSERQIEVHANYITAMLAKKFQGRCIQFFAPAVLSSKEIRNGLFREKAYQEIRQCYDHLKVILVGVGAFNRGATTLIRSGYMDQEELDDYINQGAVGDISLQLFDKSGDLEPFKSFNERVVGLPLARYKEVQYRVCVVSDANKLVALGGVLAGGFANVLIIDEDCALGLLQS